MTRRASWSSSLAAVFVIAALGGCRPRPAPTFPAPPPVARTLAVSGAASSLTRLTSDPADEFYPHLSPSRDALMFSAARSVGGTYTAAVLVSVDPTTGARRTIYTPESAFSVHVDWMPDGSSFVYRSNRSGPFALVRSLSASPNSGVAILLDGNQAPDIGWPSLAPDGRSLAAHAVLAGTPSIITLSLGTNQYAVLGEGQQPDFSPDGRRVVFSRRVGDTTQLFSMRAADGTDLIQVTTGAFSATQPCFSPNGDWIVFASNRSSSSTVPLNDGTWNLFAIHPDGSGLTQVTDGNSETSSPYWAADGMIYFSSNQAEGFDIWRLRPEGL